MVMQDVNHQLFTESVLDEVLLDMNARDKKHAKNIIESLNLKGFEELHPLSYLEEKNKELQYLEFIMNSCSYILHLEEGNILDFYPLNNKEGKKNL